MRCVTIFVALLTACLLTFGPAAGAEKKKTAAAKNVSPPMLVAVEDVVAGSAEPMQELVGTVFFARVSKVAAEVEGLVTAVTVEEGDRVGKGKPLVRLATDILETEIARVRQSYEQAVIDMEQARKDLQRLKSLYSDKLIAETTYDNQLARAQGLEKQVAGLQAELDRLRLEKEKKIIRAPFDGMVLQREIEQGEWVGVGGIVAVVADDSAVDVIVDVPQPFIKFLDKGRKITVEVGGQSYAGRFLTVIPQGDIATRTFSIKIRLENRDRLIEGMAATALLPVDKKIEGLLVPRDAVIEKFGKDVVFTIVDGLAKMVPIQITSYAGMKVGVKGTGLEAGQKVVVKGNERIRDGQPVRLADNG